MQIVWFLRPASFFSIEGDGGSVIFLLIKHVRLKWWTLAMSLVLRGLFKNKVFVHYFNWLFSVKMEKRHSILLEIWSLNIFQLK